MTASASRAIGGVSTAQCQSHGSPERAHTGIGRGRGSQVGPGRAPAAPPAGRRPRDDRGPGGSQPLRAPWAARAQANGGSRVGRSAAWTPAWGRDRPALGGPGVRVFQPEATLRPLLPHGRDPTESRPCASPSPQFGHPHAPLHSVRARRREGSQLDLSIRESQLSRGCSALSAARALLQAHRRRQSDSAATGAQAARRAVAAACSHCPPKLVEA